MKKQTSILLTILLLRLAGMSYAQQPVIPLYSGVAPGSENAKQKEITFVNADQQPRIRNVTQPTLTAFLPDKAQANGTAIILAPGGGFVHLAMEKEGNAVARWLQARGVAAFVLKYRLQDSDTEEEYRAQAAAMARATAPQPGTGGLTRLVDKRKIRRDRADVFSTLAEGLKAKRAKEWGLIDDCFPTTKFEAAIAARAKELAANAEPAQGIKLHPLQIESTDNTRAYRHVSLRLHRDKRYAELTVRGPETPPPTSTDEIQELGDAWWPLAAFRELDNALLHLRVNEPEIGLVTLHTTGDIENVLAIDRTFTGHREHWLVRETLLLMARTLRRLDLTAKSFFALIEPGSCFAGSLLELALAADRTYMLNDLARPVEVATSELNAGALPMSNGLTRLQSRFLAAPEQVKKVLQGGRFDTEAADEVGLITAAPDDPDWDDEIRLAIEERTSLSPDALTGLEANLRFAGAETHDTKIFGRLTAWQNWIFQRPNAVGEHGALTNYGKPTQAKFDYRRT